MGKRGSKPKGNVRIKWSANFAYAVGLIASDGSLSKDKRHISLISKDFEQLENFNKCLNFDFKISTKFIKNHKSKYYYRIQFSDVIFYKFLESIGIKSNKSKTIGLVDVPKEYFFDFLRGTFDGDGCFYSYWDKRWRSSHLFYLEFISASYSHLEWVRSEICMATGVLGHLSLGGKSTTLQLKYAKRDALEIIRRMYYNRDVVCLSRKRQKIEKALEVEKKQQNIYKVLNNARVLKLVDIYP